MALQPALTPSFETRFRAPQDEALGLTTGPTAEAVPSPVGRGRPERPGEGKGADISLKNLSPHPGNLHWEWVNPGKPALRKHALRFSFASRLRMRLFLPSSGSVSVNAGSGLARVSSRPFAARRPGRQIYGLEKNSISRAVNPSGASSGIAWPQGSEQPVTPVAFSFQVARTS